MDMIKKKHAKVREWLDAIEDAQAALANFGLYLHEAELLGTSEEEFHAELRKLRDQGLEGWVDGPMDIDETFDLLMGYEPDEPEVEPLTPLERQLLERALANMT